MRPPFPRSSSAPRVSLPLAVCAAMGVTGAVTAAVAATPTTIAPAERNSAAPGGSAFSTLYRQGPPTGHTGGFGEPLCDECHFGGPVNDPAGVLILDVPATFEPGTSYHLRVTLTHPELAAAGFQLAARFADGTASAEQAGTLQSADARVAVTVDTASGVLYAHQTESGAVASDTARWTVRWIAPDTAAPVVIHVAANAANDDASEFGDFVYSASRRTRTPAR